MTAPEPVPGPPIPEPATVYPLGLRVAGRRVVVIGGGRVAERRSLALHEAGAAVIVIAPSTTPGLARRAGEARWTFRHRPYRSGDLEHAWLVLACTDDPAVNATVAAEAEARRVWCVRADDAERSAAWVPAVGRTGRFTVAVHADRDPRRAAAGRDACLRSLASHPDTLGGTPD
ncbi:MAG: precorrin-2 dehydrogenase/sirohydrochlorin ferrochelatase family protein [Actinomycetes bacterium]